MDFAIALDSLQPMKCRYDIWNSLKVLPEQLYSFYNLRMEEYLFSLATKNIHWILGFHLEP